MSFAGKLPDVNQIQFKDIGSTSAGTVPANYLGVVARSGRLLTRTAAGVEATIAGSALASQGAFPNAIFVGSVGKTIATTTFTQPMGMTQFGNGYILASATGVGYSTDGEAFTASSTPFASPMSVAADTSFTTAIIISATQYSISSNGITWAAPVALPVTTASKIFYLKDAWFILTTTGLIVRSPDGTTWTTVYTHGASRALIDMTYSPTSGLFCCVGGAAAVEGIILTSSNGTSWVQRSSPYTQPYNSVCATLTTNRLVIVGALGSVAWSDDGTTWNTATGQGSSTFIVVWHIAATTNSFAMLATNGGYFYSTTGQSWSLFSSGNSFDFSSSLPIARAGRVNLQQGWYGDSSTYAYLTPRNPGLSTLSSPFAGISYGGSSGGYSFKNASCQTIAMIGNQGCILNGAASFGAISQLISGVTGYIGENIVSTTVSSDVTLNSNIFMLGVSLGPGIYRLQATIHYQITASVAGTQQWLTVGVGNNTWSVGTSGNTFRPGENYTESMFNGSVSSLLPTRMTVVCPPVMLYYHNNLNTNYILPGGNANTLGSSVPIVSGIFTTGGTVTAVTRRVFVVVNRVI